MDFLNPIIAQVRDLFATMTPGARVTAGLLLAVVVVSLGFLFQQAASGPDEFLFGGDPIERGRLPRIEAALGIAGINFDTEGNRIRVARSDKNAAYGAIASADELPPEFHKLMEDAMNGGGMFDFRDLKMQRVRVAREAQASMILSEFPWVDTARVMHNQSTKPGLRGGRHATAAVSITPAVGESLTTKRVRTVKDFVSKACDVPIDQIAVTGQGGDSATESGVSPEDFEHPFFRQKALAEEWLKGKILAQLSEFPGVKVEVTAHLENVSERTTVSIQPDSQPVTLSKETLNETNEQSAGRPGDRVGQVANGPKGIGSEETVAARDQSKQTTDRAKLHSVVGQTQKTEVFSGYPLKEADASVAIPMSYVEAVYRIENPDPDGNPPEQIDPVQLQQKREEIANNVEEIVQPLLPKLALGQNEYAQVNVRFFRDLPEDPLPQPSVAAGALAWTGQYMNTIAMTGLAIFSLVMLRSMVGSAGKEGSVEGLPSLQLDGETLAEAATADDEDLARPKLKLKKPDTLKDDLADMVASDPDAAAAILKSWINNNAA
ncbi:flagellar MS-ring protein [Planctomycetes bacterium MalM25]|nr:flagellar MS-ring protein [Planctomycetes bacterium MalM25]